LVSRMTQMKYLLYLIIAFTVSIPSFAHAQTTTVERVIDGDTIVLTDEVETVIQQQIDKEINISGYENFELVYVARKGDSIIAAVFSHDGTNQVFNFKENRYDSKKVKFLSGYIVRKQPGGDWMYVSGRTTSYNNDDKFVEMKSWADEIQGW